MLCDPLTPVIKAANGMKRPFISNTSCFSNLYLIECFRNCKSKSCLKAILRVIEKILSIPKKKLDCLKIIMCRRVHLRRMKVKGFVHKWQMRENTIRTDVSCKHEMCFMMKSTFKVMDTCLWYLNSGCLQHMTGDCSLFKVFEPKKSGNVTFGDGSKSQIKGKETISLPGLPNISNVLYVEV